MVDADRRHPPLQAAELIVVAEDQQDFRLVVGLAERARDLAVVDLPSRTLGVAIPDVAVVAGKALPSSGLEADVVIGIARVQVYRLCEGVSRDGSAGHTCLCERDGYGSG